MKEKVVHTRVSDDLYKKISSKAKTHRVTISNLIRNLVEDSLEISGDVLDLVDDRIKKNLYKKEAILGFQTITLSKDANCDSCEINIKKGTNANLAFLDNSSRKMIVCDSCRKEAKTE